GPVEAPDLNDRRAVHPLTLVREWHCRQLFSAPRRRGWLGLPKHDSTFQLDCPTLQGEGVPHKGDLSPLCSDQGIGYRAIRAPAAREGPRASCPASDRRQTAMAIAARPAPTNPMTMASAALSGPSIRPMT